MLMPASVPDGMTPEKLRAVAHWLDTYDELFEHIVIQVKGDIEIQGDALIAARGKEVQTDLRRWADELEKETES